MGRNAKQKFDINSIKKYAQDVDVQAKMLCENSLQPRPTSSIKRLLHRLLLFLLLLFLLLLLPLPSPIRQLFILFSRYVASAMRTRRSIRGIFVFVFFCCCCRCLSLNIRLDGTVESSEIPFKT